MKRSPRAAAALEARRSALRARLRRHPRLAPRKRRRRWPWLVVPLLILLLLLRRCSCAEPPPEPPPEPTGLATAPAPAPAPEPPAAPIDRRDRPDFASEAPAPLAWLDAYRLQVAARSPRLAECFVGAEQPGALKWTASVEPATGRVSDHVLEPVLETAPLTSAQRACVLEVLSRPPYRLEAAGARSTPSRVGIAIEF